MDCSDRLRPLIMVSNTFFLDELHEIFSCTERDVIDHSVNIRNIIKFLLRIEILKRNSINDV